MALITIGVDIAKDTLAACCLPGGEAHAFPNTRQGYIALHAWHTKRGAERIVFEPTGPYHKAFKRSLAQAGIPYAKVNPLQVRRFAEAAGTRAKTDPVDACVLARFGMALNPPATKPCSNTFAMLQELLVARRTAVKRQTAVKNQGPPNGSLVCCSVRPARACGNSPVRSRPSKPKCAGWSRQTPNCSSV